MGIYYLLTDDGEVFEMDATVSFTLIEAGRLTNYTVEDGATLSDHYVNENARISMQGIITDVKGQSASSGVKSTDEYIGGLLAAKNSSKPLVVYWRGSGPLAGTFRKDCMIERINFEQSGGNGSVDEAYAYDVSIELSQFRKAQAAILTRETLPALKDSSSEKKSSNATTVKADNTSVTSGEASKTTAIGEYTNEQIRSAL